MKNFTIILFVFFVLFLLLSLFVSDSLLLFLLVFMAFLIAFICLSEYLGAFRGIITGLSLIILPFLLEYLLRLLNIPFFQSSLINSMSTKNIDVPITMANLFTIFTLPLLFICSLFFAQKMKLFFNIKKFLNTSLVIVCAILTALNFLVIKEGIFNYQEFLKWLAIALLVNLLIYRLYKFKTLVPDVFRELPIIIFLIIYSTNAMKLMQMYNLIIAGILTIIYLLLLYNEYKFKKISQASA